MAVIPGFGVKELPFFFGFEFLFYLLEFQQLPFLSFVFGIFLPMSIMFFFVFILAFFFLIEAPSWQLIRLLCRPPPFV